MSARHQNANPDYPIQLEAPNIFESIRNEIELYAKTARRKAEVKQNTLQIRYQYTPSDEEMFRREIAGDCTEIAISQYHLDSHYSLIHHTHAFTA